MRQHVGGYYDRVRKWSEHRPLGWLSGGGACTDASATVYSGGRARRMSNTNKHPRIRGSIISREAHHTAATPMGKVPYFAHLLHPPNF